MDVQETEAERREREEYERDAIGLGLPLEPGDKEWQLEHGKRVVVSNRPKPWRQPNPWWKLETDEGDCLRIDDQGFDNFEE